MAGYSVKALVHFSMALLILLGCLVILSTPASAQVGNAAKIRMQEMDQRELQLRDPPKGKRKEPDARMRAVMNQVNEDFQRLLMLHNEIVRTILSNDSPNYQFVSDATSEIKKRATRLQSTLELHKPEVSETQEMQNRQTAPTKEDLTLLCKKIESFIKNPIIETPGTVDVKELEKARRDLESVIELSAAITKRAEKQKH
jgi:hypothetical protein